jgi:hypothetical protein
MTDTPDTATEPSSTEPSLAVRQEQMLSRHPWMASAALLELLTLLAVAGLLARLLLVPSPITAGITWAVLAAAIAGRSYQALRTGRDATASPPPGTWQPGQLPPEGIPAGTVNAVGNVLARFRSRRYPRGAWLEIIPCADPVRHGICTRAGARPDTGGVRVFIGEHVAGHPAAAAWMVAHEIRHPAGWTYHLWVIATAARLAAWPAAGWAVPWPWLLAALAGIQAAYVIACWVIEVGCDLGGARVTGRAAAFAGLSYLGSAAHERRRIRPAWQRYPIQLVINAAAQSPHPPNGLRGAIIRALVRK